LIGAGVFPAVVLADEAASKGKFVQGKGTKSNAAYQGTAGGPLYEYGRGLQLGPINLKPYIEYIAKWESNIFYDPSGEKDDFIHRVDLGLTAEMPFGGGQHTATASYLAEIEWFSRFDNQNHDDHTIQGDLDLNYVPFGLNVKDVFRKTVSRADTEFTERVKRDENTFNSLLEIPFTKFFLETELEDFNIDYDSAANSVFDHNILTVFQRVGFDIAPSTQLLAEYGHLFIGYDRSLEERDGHADQISMGLRGNWGAKITYQVWPGVQWRIYDEASRPDYHDFILRAALQYDITEKSNIILRGSRNPVESTFDGQSFYTQNRGEIAWRQQIAERIYFQTNETLNFNEYSRTSTRGGQDKVREDAVWQTGLSLEYFMPNELVMLFCEYKFTGRDSNTFDLDYGNHSVSAGIRGNF